MTYEIHSLWKPHLPLTPKQTQSLKFEYEPRVGLEVVKHDFPVKNLTLAQVYVRRIRLIELLDSESVELRKVGEAGWYNVTADMLRDPSFFEEKPPVVIEPPTPAPETFPVTVVAEMPDGTVKVRETEAVVTEATTPVPVEPPAPLVTPDPQPEPVPEPVKAATPVVEPIASPAQAADPKAAAKAAAKAAREAKKAEKAAKQE